MGRALEAEPSDVLGGRFAHEGTKESMEVMRCRCREACEILEREWVVEVLLDVDQRREDALLVARSGQGVPHRARLGERSGGRLIVLAEVGAQAHAALGNRTEALNQGRPCATLSESFRPVRFRRG